jgi:hypothetical protein
MSIDRKYLVCALAYAAAGMSLGIYMAASGNHAQFVTHAHIMLVGFVVSLMYAIIYRLWLPGPTAALSRVQFLVHQLGAILMTIGLYLLYGGIASEPKMEPILGIASIAVLVAMLLMLMLVLRKDARASSATVPAT